MSLAKAAEQLQRGVDEGLHYGAQLAVMHGGRLTEICVGEARPGEPMSGEHVLCWSSSVKPVMAICLAQLQEQGLLCFDDPVAKFLPAFKAQGKGLVTIRHCLTHTAGLWGSMMDRSLEAASPEEVLRHISAQPLAERWTVGARCGYDSPAWYVLAGVVTAADLKHRSFQRYAEEEVFGPLGLDSCSIGVSAERRKQLEPRGLLAPIYQRLAKTPWSILPEESQPHKVDYPCPAGNGRGPAKELCLLYASLLPSAGDAAVKRLLAPKTVEMITTVARRGIVDELQGVDTDWTLGFAISCILSGRHASASAYGHGGSQSSWAFADPEHDLAVACLCNGKPGPERHYRRVGAVSTAVYEDLGLESRAPRSFALPGGLGSF